MKKPVSRRDFLQAGVLGGAGAVLAWPALAGSTGLASGSWQRPMAHPRRKACA